MNIYLVIVILIVFIALSILIGFLVDYFVIHKHFIRILENAGTNKDEILNQLFNSTRVFSCTFFGLLYVVFIFQIIVLIIINNYYNKIRNRKDVSEALSTKKKKSLSASCSI